MKSRFAVLMCLIGATAASPCAAAETLLDPDLTAEATAFVLKLPDGRVRRGVDLQGATVHLAVENGAIASVRLESIVPDPKDAGLLRHDFRVQNEQGQWVPACAPNMDGETWGFPLALPENHPGREGPITLTCVAGAVGKCARFGYKPWGKGPHGEDLLPYHATCVRMVRADYCGDGVGHTKDGTTIDLYDRLGIQASDSGGDAEFAFEAGWTPQGAVCVARTRWPELLTREQLARDCPRLGSPEDCDEASARKAGALLFNRSRLTPRVGK